MRELPKVYVVVQHNGDGYHAWDPDLLVAYFNADDAYAHAERNPSCVVEEVPLSTQLLPQKESD